MESSVNESSTSTDHSTTIALTNIPSHPIQTKSPPRPESLCRVGSGTSVVLDSENGVEAESRKLPSSKYKGVVPQPNGRWGAQIYEKHQRVWLGTFNEEQEAARAYDTAVQRFRGRDAVPNFKPLSETDEDDIETSFLNSHSKAEIVDMLRKHTYIDELEQSKRNYQHGGNGTRPRMSSRIMHAREQMFEKAVTPSDVGKLNRLVIPKQHAEKYFPLQGGNISSKGVLLNFEDVGGKVWRFRYSYWNSSQSYVLTKGWSRFVKEKELKAGDIVSFHRSTGLDKQFYIDFKVENCNTTTTETGFGSGQVAGNPVPVLRLFGVNIFKVHENNGDNNESCSDKRMREIEFSLECRKKQKVIGAL